MWHVIPYRTILYDIVCHHIHYHIGKLLSHVQVSSGPTLNMDRTPGFGQVLTTSTDDFVGDCRSPLMEIVG